MAVMVGGSSQTDTLAAQETVNIGVDGGIEGAETALTASSDGHEEEHSEPAEATFFPSIVLTLGALVFFMLSRYLHALPYTAAMFLLGVAMGLGVALRDDADHHIHNTIEWWTSINSEVLLLVFLPGLIYKDAFGLNVHLFRVALLQSVVFAFPMVLAGTSLTAMVARYILPVNWRLDLSLLFGAILSATDVRVDSS